MVSIYGKLPEYRDFVQRNISEEVLGAWSGWLTDGLRASRSVLGDELWANCYLDAPIWRFVIPSGILSDQRWVGTLMPSMDGGGRHFPLTVLWPVPSEHQALKIIRLSIELFEQIEASMLEVLDEHITFEQFELFLSRVELNVVPPASDEAPELMLVSAAGRQYRQLSVESIEQFPDAIDALVDDDRAAELGRYSTWWTRGSQRTKATILFFGGLPSVDEFQNLLDRPQNDATMGSPNDTTAANRVPTANDDHSDDGLQPDASRFETHG